MGRPKQTLAYRGSTLTGIIVRSLLEVDVAGVVVVTRTEFMATLDLPSDPRVRTVVNDDGDSEMIDSIRIGLATVARFPAVDVDGVLVVPGDMPMLHANTVRNCIAAYRDDPDRIVVACHEGKRGHPMIFPFALRTVIENLSDGLRMLLQQLPDRVREVVVADSGVILDVDTPEDYQQL